MNTEKLYYQDSHLTAFQGAVVSCRAEKDVFLVELDRTAFFPEGGGQGGDVGTLNGEPVLDTHIVGDTVLHSMKKPLEVGERVHGVVDWAVRFPRMQAHTAEHIVSGLVHRRFGFDNEGFHMGAEGVIVDFDGFVPPEALEEIEEEANRAVWEDHIVTTSFPDPAELPGLTYRSKLDLRENVRLVTIEGVDVCACCAPHVKRTGEVGAVKIFESIRRKDGVRLRMLAGEAAFRDYRERFGSLARASALLSASPALVPEAVERLMRERDELSYALGGARRELIRLKTADLPPIPGDRLFFEPAFTAQEAKLLCDAALSSTGGVALVIFGAEGSFRYVAESASVDLGAWVKAFNQALRGRGGGKGGQVSGSVAATREEIETFIKSRTTY